MAQQLIITDLDFYLSFEGRISREKFLMQWFIPFITIGLLLLALGAAMTMLPYNLYCILTFFPSMALNSRRLHDYGKSGWWQLMLLLPFINIVWYIWAMLIRKGEPEENEYGPVPPTV